MSERKWKEKGEKFFDDDDDDDDAESIRANILMTE